MAKRPEQFAADEVKGASGVGLKAAKAPPKAKMPKSHVTKPPRMKLKTPRVPKAKMPKKGKS